MALKYGTDTKLVGGFIISKVYLGSTRFPYYLYHNANGYGDWVNETVITDLLEKPKVKLPKFVAEYLEEHKGGVTLAGVINGFGTAYSRNKEISDWLSIARHQELFARAWLDGYDIEKEKMYTAKLKLTDEYLAYDNDNVEYYFTDEEMASKFTEEEFKKMKFWDNPAFEIKEAY